MNITKFFATMIMAVWLAPAVANARNPISPFCVAHIANANADGHTKDAHLDECAVCDSQRDNGWEELGNITNDTCEGLVRMLTPGKTAKCDKSWARGLCVAFQRCLAAGTQDGKGGIVFKLAELPKPASERPPVDLEALKAKVNSRITALVVEKQSLNNMGDHSRDADLDAQIKRYQDWLDRPTMDGFGQALYDELMRQVTPQPEPKEPEPKELVRAPSLTEATAIPTSAGVIGAIGGGLVGWGGGLAILTTGLATGGVGLAVGVVGVGIWWLVSD